MLTRRAVEGLGYPSNSRVREFLDQLEEQYLLLHPYSGEAWIDWYQKTVAPILVEVDKEPVGAQRVIYNAIFHRVIQPTGQSLEPREVDLAMKTLKGMVDDLAIHYHLPNDLPPSPATEPLGLLRRGQARRPTP